MLSAKAPSVSKPLARGTYAHSTKLDVRGPCPMINTLANHGYIPRDGRNVRKGDIVEGLNQVGLSTALIAAFANPIFLETKASQPPRTLLQNLWYWTCNPWALLFSATGMRRPGQKDAMGHRCLDLDQLDLPGVVEHDISITRLDHGQGDNHTPQPDLIKDLLDSSSDGGKTISIEDLVALRRRRIHKQLETNPGLTYGSPQHLVVCTEIALILHVFGDGKSVSREYVRAFFQEERLPILEGWKKRGWFWPLGIVELVLATNKVKKIIGIKF